MATFDADEPVPFLMFHSDTKNLYGEVGATPPEYPSGFCGFSRERIATADRRADVYRLMARRASGFVLVPPPLCVAVEGQESASSVTSDPSD